MFMLLGIMNGILLVPFFVTALRLLQHTLDANVVCPVSKKYDYAFLLRKLDNN